MSTDPTAAVLDGLALQRATGAPALACLAGYRAVAGPGPGSTLTAAVDAAGTAGPTDLAMLVDLAAGAAIRAQVGAGRRLATTAMAVHLLGALPPTAGLAVHVPEVVARERSALATGTVLAGGEAIGHASVAFALLGDGLTPIPWEHAGPVPARSSALREDELTADERAGLAHVRSAGAHSWSEAVLRGATSVGAEGLELRPTGLLTNRAGGVQGGVLVGLAVLAAQAGDGGDVLSSVQVDFVAPATVGEPVLARVDALRSGRRSRLARVGLVQLGGLVVAATVGLRTT